MSSSPESTAVNFPSSPPPSPPVDSQLPSTRPAVPSLRPVGALVGPAHPLGVVNAARGVRPSPSVIPNSTGSVPLAKGSFGPNGLPSDMAERLKKFQASRHPPPSPVGTTPTTSNPPGGLAGGAVAFTPVLPGNGMSPRMNRPPPQNWNSAPAPVNGAKMSLGARRGIGKLGGLPGGLNGLPPAPATADPSSVLTDPIAPPADGAKGSLFNKYAEYLDTNTGTLKFAGKAVIRGDGVDFSSGSSFNISLDQVESLCELGKGNYGTVYKVIHRKPKARVAGGGVAGVPAREKEKELESRSEHKDGTGVVMAMKEIRLELDDAKFAAIIMELDILHRCVSPYIIDFYGAFFQEGAVYICIEFMDGGSLDELYGEGVPEDVLRKITWSTVMGLKSLKDDHKIIHRDVKPTNILVNSRGEVKICDFGVSGNLVASIAKTNIGCQSYMAPERISSGGMAQAGGSNDGTYGVQSDVWSLGLSILECAMGRYPYPPETYNNIFSQLSAIVNGAPPELPESFSNQARDFVLRTLHKIPKMRPSYQQLLAHPWIADMSDPPSIHTIGEEDEDAEDSTHVVPESAPRTTEKGFPEVRDWVISQMEKRRKRVESGGKWGSEKPALHTVALDKVTSPVENGSVPNAGRIGEGDIAQAAEKLALE